MRDRLLRYLRYPHRRIGEVLVAAKAVTEDEVAEALATQEEKGDLIGRILIERGACGTEDVAAALLKQVRFTAVDLGRVAPQPGASRLLARDVCRRLRVFPFEVLGDILCVAMMNVLSKKAIVETERATGLKMKAFKATHDEIMAAIDRHYPED